MIQVENLSNEVSHNLHYAQILKHLHNVVEVKYFR